MSFSEISLKMNKFNQKFNKHLVRFERWHRIEVMLSYARGMTSSRKYDSASPEEIRCMKEIHGKLCECLKISGDMLKEAKIV